MKLLPSILKPDLLKFSTTHFLLLLLILQFGITSAEAEESHLATNSPVGGLNCESECYYIGEDVNSETDISTVSEWWFDYCVRVFGTLYVDENTTLDEAQMLMMPGSEIVIESGNTLSLVSSLLMGCDTLWKGIRVEDGGRLRCVSDTIRDANAAIFLEDGAFVEADYNRFENNYIGIASGMPFDAISTAKSVSGRMAGNYFVNTANLLVPHTGHYYAPNWPTGSNIPYNKDYAGVYLRQTTGLNIGIDYNYATWENEFAGTRNGIVLDTSVANVVYCDITNLAGTLTSSQLIEDLTSTGIYMRGSIGVVKSNYLDNMQDGVVSDHSTAKILDNTIELKIISLGSNKASTRGISVLNTVEDHTVDGNSIYEANVGIFAYRVFTFNSSITDNIIESESDGADRIGILLQFFWNPLPNNPLLIAENEITFTDVQSAEGIWMHEAHHFLVSENVIEFIRENQFSPTNSNGIRTYFCHSGAIEDNIIEGEGSYVTTLHFGIFYENTRNTDVLCNNILEFNRAFAGGGSCQSTDLVGNQFQLSNPLGLELRAPTSLGLQEHYGNHWGSDDHGSFGAFISGPNPIETAQACQFLVDNDGQCVNWPCPIGPAAVLGIWFDDVPGTDSACTPLPVPSGLTDEDYEDILMDTCSFSDFEDQMTWMTKEWIFRSLLEDEDLLQNTRLDSFFDADDSEPVGVLATAKYRLNEAFDSAEELVDVSNEIMDSLDVIAQIDLDLINLSADSTALRSQRDNAVEEMSTLHVERIELLKEWDSDQQSAWSSAESALNSLTTKSDFEEYFKRALLYKIELLTDGLSSLSSGDWDEIYEIASLCTWEGGAATGIAQSISFAGRDSIVGSAKGCTGVEPRSSLQISSNVVDSFEVYPNPSSSGWTVVVPQNEGAVLCYSPTGAIIAIHNLKEGRAFISTKDLLPGVYVLKVVDMNKAFVASKQVLLQH